MDALSRDAAKELVVRLGIKSTFSQFLNPIQKSFIKSLSPSLSTKDKQVVDSLVQLVSFFINASDSDEKRNTQNLNDFLDSSIRGVTRERVIDTLAVVRGFLFSSSTQHTFWFIYFSFSLSFPSLSEYGPSMRSFGISVASRLVEKGTSRFLRASSDAVFGPTVIASV